MTFYLSQKSLSRLQGVDKRLFGIVCEAIKISTVDFAVGEGLRTLERQKFLIARGKSKIKDPKNSKHVQGLAVDLYAYVNNNISWDEKHYYKIAEAMQQVIKNTQITLRWGAVWDRTLNEISDCKSEPTYYAQRRKSLGKKAFLDFVHFEIME